MIKDSIIYDGFLKLVNRQTNNISREIIIQDEAVAICLINRDRSKLLLVKQFRPAICQYTWEIPAGMMDVPGETKEECLLRELKEEADIEIPIDSLKKELSYYPNIGVSNHKITVFSAITEEVKDKDIADDSDAIEAKWFFDWKIRAMVNNGKIVDGKTITIFYKLFGDILL